jgi:glucuronokinase
MNAACGRAYARAALLGNPSDGYGGRTVSFLIRNFSAEVTVRESRRAEIDPGPAQPPDEPSGLEAVRRTFESEGCEVVVPEIA